MKHLILGTAGHIDHGKTALVKMLTGVDCDRLPEEKARGITIELGFAGFDLPGGGHIGVVDVPGHERFVHTMVAGAAGIDLILLVVAADEGLMPQTREHLDICRLLAVRHGLIALTKTDLVEPEMLDLARAEVEEFVEGTFLEGAPVVPVSSVRGEGRDELLAAIAEVAARVTPKNAADLPRLPIDRVFTMKGFGTVVTGTLVSGAFAVGEEVAVEPNGPRARVRGLQVHNHAVDRADAGLRTAVNLQNVDRESVRRGQVLVRPDAMEGVAMIDARVTLLPGAPRPLRRRSRVRLHAYTAETACRAHPLSTEELLPGHEAVVQLRLETPLLLLPGDRFVLRSWSPMATVGGGVVLNVRAAKYRAPYDSALADLAVLESGALTERLGVLFRRAGKDGLAYAALRGLLGVPGKDLDAAYQRLLSAGQVIRFDPGADRAIDRACFDEVCAESLRVIDAYHAERPEASGIARGELAARVMYGLLPRLAARVLTALEKSREIEVDGDAVRRAGFRPGFTGGALAVLTEKLAEALATGGATPPTQRELTDGAGAPKADVDRALNALVQDGRAVRVSPTLFYDRAALDALLAAIGRRLDEAGEIDAQAMKDLTGLTRKYAIPLLEYADAVRLTLRVGDKRIRRGSRAT